ncbi:MAG: alginate export family protein [Bacteroidetes bacterium]|nr:alginate export family protein [Bacteroidota bacterium]
MAFLPVLAEAQFIISGDLDTRLNYLNLRRTVSDSLNNKLLSVLGTAELDLAYNGRRWNAFVSLYASYTKGTNLFSVKTPGTLNFTFNQAWVRYIISKSFSLQAGRIEIEYDDQRFFEARDWSGLVTSHNAIIVHYFDPDTSAMADLGFAANRFKAAPFNTDPNVNNYRYLTYLYMHKRLLDEQLNLTFMNIFNADDNGLDPKTLYGRNTFGGSAWLSTDDWNFNLAGFYQFGNINDGRRLSSGYYAAYVSYQPTEWLCLMQAFEHMSGDNLADSAEWKKVIHGFSLLYGNMNRSFGNSGIFNSSYRTNLNPGLNNLYFVATFDILHNFSIEASYHWFSIPHPYIREYVPDSNKIMIVKVPESFMHQVEVLFSYTPVPSLEISLDYQMLFPGKGMINYNGWNFTAGSPVTSAYIEVEWTPIFYPRNKRSSILKP